MAIEITIKDLKPGQEQRQCLDSMARCMREIEAMEYAEFMERYGPLPQPTHPTVPTRQ